MPTELDTYRAEVQRLQGDLDRLTEHNRRLSDAYVRLRVMIPGALDTPFAPTSEQVWEITEKALTVLIESKKPNVPLQVLELHRDRLRLADTFREFQLAQLVFVDYLIALVNESEKTQEFIDSHDIFLRSKGIRQ